MNREEFQKELHKMRQMNARDRLWYLGAYYKVPILIGLAVIFLLYQAAGAFLRSRQDCMLYCAFINQSYTGKAQIEELKEDFYARQGYDHQGFQKRQILTFDTSLSLTGSPDDKLYNDASSILFQSLLGTETLDIVITKEAILEQYSRENIFLNLEQALSPELFEYLASEDVLCHFPDSSGQPYPVGISLKDSALISRYGLDEDSILGICTLENHPDVIEDFVRFVFGL